MSRYRAFSFGDVPLYLVFSFGNFYFLLLPPSYVVPLYLAFSFGNSLLLLPSSYVVPHTSYLFSQASFCKTLLFSDTQNWNWVYREMMREDRIFESRRRRFGVGSINI